jgi:iron(III) transport system ATP-binding protein
LEITDLSFRYPGNNNPLVLDGYSLSLGEGEFVGLAGSSGSGKSTLLRLIAGFERPLSGSIVIDGLGVSSKGRFVPPERRNVGMVFQDYGLFPHMTVSQNIAYGLHRLGKGERLERLGRMLELVRLGDLGGRLPAELSGGQQQRVALARALAPSPKVLLLDEPMSSLDADLKENLRREVAGIIRATGTTSVFVSHDLADLDRACDRVVRM